MKLSVASHFDEDTFLSNVKNIALVLASSCVLIASYFFVRPVNLQEEFSAFSPDKNKPLFAYEAIGTGPLTLNPHLFYRSVPALLQEVVFVKKEVGPGLEKSSTFLFGIKNMQQIFPVNPGEEIHLEVDEKDPGMPLIRIGSEKSSFSIRPLLSEKEGVLVAARMKGGKEGDQEINLLIKEVSFNDFNREVQEQFEKSKPVKLLQAAKSWNHDCLYNQYGGRVYSGYKTASKVEISDGAKTSFELVKEGDVLCYEEGIWKLSSDFLRAQDLIRAQILSINDQGVRLKIWDTTGLLTTNVVVNSSKCSGVSALKEELIPKACKLRSATRVSCVLGKKRFLLRKGDWVLKTNAGYRVLRTSQDIKDCLEHKIKGLLLILDELTVEADKAFLVGHLFNEMRTDIQEVKMNVEVPKKPKRTSYTNRKKKVGAEIKGNEKI